MKAPLAMIVVSGLSLATPALAQKPAQPTAQEVLQKVIDADAWALQGADVSARVVIVNAKGARRELAYTARSLRYSKSPALAKALLRFTAPVDMAGMGFLQVQNGGGKDDDRWLYLPDLKKTRRIAGSSRSQAFMGTDFSYADLDQGEYRGASAKLLGAAKLANFDCYHLEITPTLKGPIYSKIEVWVRKDNFLPLKTVMYNAGGAPAKELTAQEVKRVGGKWYLTKSTMKNLLTSTFTQVILEKIEPKDNIPDAEFTPASLTK